MIILHYSLGFPPYRSGGLTKFSIDLMKQQLISGHEVALMWPGQINFICRRLSIRRSKKDIGEGLTVDSFEIINPLPVPFDEGINRFAAFMINEDIQSYINLLDDYRPDVIHIHTFMGLHKTFLEAAKEKGIRLVFSAHDFFPICPKVTMFRDGHICDSVETCSVCGACNTTALSLLKIRLLQSPLYRKTKDSSLVKKLRKKHRDEYLSDAICDAERVPIGGPEDYLALRSYYSSMLYLMDVVHYNSSVTQRVYEKYLGNMCDCVIPVSHTDISDCRKTKNYTDNIIKIRYLGPCARIKGYYILKEALDDLWREKQNFRLDVHFEVQDKPQYMESHARYSYNDLESILDNTDILVAPSICYETFGFTVLEALSFGTPVIITDTVGAKDILVEGAGIVLKNTGSEELYEAIRDLNVEKLREMNNIIVDKQEIITLDKVAKRIEEECYAF